MMARMTQCHCVAASHRYFDKICFFMLEESLSVSDSLSETRASGHASSRTWQASRQVRAALPAGRPQCRASRSRWAAPGKPKPVRPKALAKPPAANFKAAPGKPKPVGRVYYDKPQGGSLFFLTFNFTSLSRKSKLRI